MILLSLLIDTPIQLYDYARQYISVCPARFYGVIYTTVYPILLRYKYSISTVCSHVVGSCICILSAIAIATTVAIAITVVLSAIVTAITVTLCYTLCYYCCTLCYSYCTLCYSYCYYCYPTTSVA